MEKLTQNINFRVSPQTKALLIEEAESKGISLSEYLNLVVSHYEELRKEVIELKRNPIQKASDIVVALSRDKEEEIRKEAIQQYLSGHEFDQNALVSELKKKVSSVETRQLMKLYQKTKDKVIVLPQNKEVCIDNISDLIDLLVSLFQFKLENR